MLLKPYKNEEHNRVEFLGVTAGVITILTGLIFLEPDSVQFINTLTLIFILSINALFFANWIYLLATEYEEKFKAAQVISQLIGCLLCIKKQNKFDKNKEDNEQEDSDHEEKYHKNIAEIYSSGHKKAKKAKKSKKIHKRKKKKSKKLDTRSKVNLPSSNDPQPSLHNTSNELLSNPNAILPFIQENPSQISELPLPSLPRIFAKDPRAFRPDQDI